MKMKLKTKIKNVIGMFKGMTSQEIQMYKYTLMVLLVADIMGIYWYFQLKSLGVALLFVLMGFLSIFLFLEKQVKGGGNKMTDKEQTAEEIVDEINNLEKEKTLKVLKDKRDRLRKESGNEEYLDLTPKKDNNEKGFDSGLPNAEEFQKRASKALGADDF